METIQLSLISGWGVNERVWEPLLKLAQRDVHVQPLALPGVASGPGEVPCAYSESSVIGWLLDHLPEHGVLCGWSLGGMLATRIAQQFPHRVISLVTVCSNPGFIATDDWPDAMPAAEFETFYQGVIRQPGRTLRRFRSLTVQGGPDQQADLRCLNRLSPVDQLSHSPALVQGLELLRSMNVRDALPEIDLPQLHILGARDALVPVSVAQSLRRLHPRAQVSVLESCGHVPMLSHPQVLLDLIRQHIAGPGAAEDLVHAG